MKDRQTLARLYQNSKTQLFPTLALIVDYGLFAYVLQGNLLLLGTVRESIAFESSNSTDEEIMAAAQMSYAIEFISSLSRGLDTVSAIKCGLLCVQQGNPH